MLIPNHPAEERLAALASHEPDATADATLTSHVASCHRCTTVIDELGALRSALAELPDLAPSRPLRLIPHVDAAPAPAVGGVAGWARRFFAPVLASGAALALVGMIGTVAPPFGGQAGSAPAADMAQTEAAAGEPAPAASEPAAPETDRASTLGAGGADAAEEQPSGSPEGVGAVISDGHELQASASSAADDSSQRALRFEDRDGLTGNRLGEGPSPWPMVLFAGVALMVGAVLFRYVLAPRAG